MVVLKEIFVVLVIILNQVNLEYAGEDFPRKYLHPEDEVPSDSDLDLYLDRLTRLTHYLTKNVNYTDVHQAISCFFTSAILKRTLHDYNHKLEKYKKLIRTLINNTTNILFHYIYLKRNLGWGNLEYRLSRVMKDDGSIVLSIRNFSQGLLKEWMFKAHANEFVHLMDRLALPKEMYVELVETMDGSYDITGYDSDKCLSRLAENMDPLNDTHLYPCKLDEFCKDKMFTSPSVAYTLSHRLLNSIMYLHGRRCYHFSPRFDGVHMDMLCAAMLREAVYIARRGFFYRDLFLEQIGLCGQLGYEEFHRRHWFHKAASWIDSDGCMQEFANFEINRTRLIVSTASTAEDKKKMWKRLIILLRDECHHHPMAVALMVFANAVRHATHFKNRTF